LLAIALAGIVTLNMPFGLRHPFVIRHSPATP
jgi:hypothetical protein